MKQNKLLNFLKKKVPTIAGKLLSGVPFVGGIADVAMDLINDDPDLTPEQRAELQRDATNLKLEQSKLDAEMTRSGHELEKVQLESEDKFTKRARPSRMYAWLAVIVFAFIVFPLLAMINTPITDIKPLLLPEFFWYIMLGDAGLYSVLRTQEKLKGNGNTGILNGIGSLFKKE